MNSGSFDDLSQAAGTGSDEAPHAAPLSETDPAFANWRRSHPSFLRELLAISDELVERWLRGTVAADALASAREDLETVRRLELAALLCRAARIRVTASAERDERKRALALGAYLDDFAHGLATGLTTGLTTGEPSARECDLGEVDSDGQTNARREPRLETSEFADAPIEDGPVQPGAPPEFVDSADAGVEESGSRPPARSGHAEEDGWTSAEFEQWRRRVRVLLLRGDPGPLPRALQACRDQDPLRWPAPLELTRSAWMLAPSFRLRMEMARACVAEGELVRADAIYRALWRDSVTRSERTQVLGGVAIVSELRADLARAQRCWMRAFEVRSDNAAAAVAALVHSIRLGREADARAVAQRIAEDSVARECLLFSTRTRALFARRLRSGAGNSGGLPCVYTGSSTTPEADLGAARRLRIELIGLGHPTLTDVCLELAG